MQRISSRCGGKEKVKGERNLGIYRNVGGNTLWRLTDIYVPVFEESGINWSPSDLFLRQCLVVFGTISSIMVTVSRVT